MASWQKVMTSAMPFLLRFFFAVGKSSKIFLAVEIFSSTNVKFGANFFPQNYGRN